MVTKLNRKSLRAQQARNESESLRVCSHCPSLCCTQTLSLGHVPNADPDDRQKLHPPIPTQLLAPQAFLLILVTEVQSPVIIVKFGVIRCTPSLDVQH